MYLMRSLLIAVSLLIAAPVAADEYSCETVSAGATAFVRFGLPVSIVETNRTCEIAVDGTISSGRAQNFTGAINSLGGILFYGDSSDYELPADMLRDMIAGPFGDENDGDGGEWGPLVQDALDGNSIFGMSQCIRDFVDIVNDNDLNNAGVPLDQMGQMTDGAVKCEVVLPQFEGVQPGMPLTSNGALKLSVTTGDAMLSLFLPVDFLRDQRDGNGTFQ